MFFLFRVVFWTAAVALFVPGALHGARTMAGIQMLETLKADAIQSLARVRTELNARSFRAP